jgi:hypothetical protein
MKIIQFLLTAISLTLIVSCHTPKASSSGGTMAATAAPEQRTVSAPVAPVAPVGEGDITKIVKPTQAAKPEDAPLSNPIEVCMKIKGYTVEPAKNGDNEGKGHHHLLIDVPLPRPENMGRRLMKDQNNLHLGNGADCKKVNLSPGLHTIRTVFSYGSHIPYNPIITDSIIVFVK